MRPAATVSRWRYAVAKNGIYIWLMACAAMSASPCNWTLYPSKLLKPAVRNQMLQCLSAGVDPSDCAGVRGDSLSGVLLPPMKSDDPAWLSFMIARYLDDEWIEQPVHTLIGEAVGKLYQESREAGDDDLVAILAKLSFGLKDTWGDAGFREAFEGPVDVANRAAEFLMLREGREVWSYGQSNSDVQAQLLKRVQDYETARAAVEDATKPSDELL